MSNFIVAASQHGLCNRLKTIVSTMRLAESIKAEPLVYWPLCTKVPAELSMLFRGCPRQIGEREFEALRKPGSGATILDGWRLALLATDQVPCDLTWQYTRRGYRVIDFCYGRIPKAIVAAYLPFFRRLTPVAPLEDRIASFSSQLPDSAVAVHLRSWSVMGDEKPAFYDLCNYVRELKRYGGRTLFVAADADRALDELRAALNNPIVTLPIACRGHDSIAKIEDAVVDLHLLARPRVLVGSFVSTFTEYAWWLGGCTQEVTIAEPRRYLWKRIAPGMYCFARRWTLESNL